MKRAALIALATGLGWGQEAVKTPVPSAEEQISLLKLERDFLETKAQQASIDEQARAEKEKLQKKAEEAYGSYQTELGKVRQRLKLEPACILQRDMSFRCPAPPPAAKRESK